MVRQQLRDDALVHGFIIDGGTAPNIIPELTRGEYLTRARDGEYLRAMNERFQAIFEAAARATGCELHLEEKETYLDLRSNPVLAEITSNPNLVLFGKPGTGKSTTVKAILFRLMLFGVRTLVAGDVKDEYEKLCRAVGVEPFALGVGMPARINPLDLGPLGQGWDHLGDTDRAERARVIFGRWLVLLKALVGAQGVPTTAAGEEALSAAVDTHTRRAAAPLPAPRATGNAPGSGKKRGHSLGTGPWYIARAPPRRPSARALPPTQVPRSTFNARRTCWTTCRTIPTIRSVSSPMPQSRRISCCARRGAKSNSWRAHSSSSPASPRMRLLPGGDRAPKGATG